MKNAVKSAVKGALKGDLKGAFITVEGVDGSGKTTQIEFIERWLKKRGVDVLRTREPGGTPLGKAIRDVLLARDGAPISERAELLLFFADRAQHLTEVILPALESGRWVLCDRFTDSTYAYQGGGHGVAREKIAVLEKLVQDGLQPDLTLLLDVLPMVGQMRVRQKDIISSNTQADAERLQVDRLEEQRWEFGNAVRKVYKQRAKRFADRIKLIDAKQTIEKVRAEIETVLETFHRKWSP